MNKTFASTAALLLIVLFVYLPSLQNGFTNWDDESYILANPLIKNLSWSGLSAMFASHDGLYKPLSILTFALEYRFFGLNPFFYHWDNLLLHLSNTLLVFWLIMLLARNSGVAFLTALLFGIHPVHVESVAWATERKDVLYSVFFLGSLIAYCYYDRRSSRVYYLLALLLFIVSLLAKPMGITLPFVLMLMDQVKGRGIGGQMLKEKVPFFAISLVFAFTGMIAMKFGTDHHVFSVDNLFIFCYSLLFYLKQVLVPVSLSAFYPVPVKAFGFYPSSVSLSVVAALVLAAGVWVTRAFTKKIIFGAFFFFITISLPCLMTFTSKVTYFAADRYLYIPALGIMYLLAEGYVWMMRRERRLRVCLGILGIFLFIWLVFLVQGRIGVWKSGQSLWEDVLKKYPREALAHNNLGMALFKEGRISEGEASFRKAMLYDPLNVQAASNLGFALLGDPKKRPEAIFYLKRAVALDPACIAAYINLCKVYTDSGMFSDALIACNKALEINPDSATALCSLGTLFYVLGKAQAAEMYFRRSLRIDPDHGPSYNGLGALYLYLGRPEAAIPLLKKAIKIMPDNAECYGNLAIAFAGVDRIDQAIGLFEKAISIDPNYGAAYGNLSLAYLRQGRLEAALSFYEKAKKSGFTNLLLEEELRKRKADAASQAVE